MKPAPFVYIRPQSTEELLDILGRVGPEAKLLAGGQSLIPMMNLRLVFPGELIDLNPLAELRYVRREEETVVIGAMTRQRALERSERVVQDLPLLAEALPYIGHWQIRNRGTVGGSLAHADPAAELPAVALALDAEIVVRGPRGLRRIAADSFFTTYLTTALAPDEVVTEVRVPIPSPGTGWAFREVARRYGDFALVLVAALVEVSDGRVARARLAVGGVADRPLRATAAEASLFGTSADRASVDSAVAALDGEIAPLDDIHASAGYRRRVARTLAAQALEQAIAMAASG